MHVTNATDQLYDIENNKKSLIEKIELLTNENENVINRINK